MSCGRGQESPQPPIHLIPNMDTQEKGKAYRADDTGLFADGRQMHLPPEGTIAIGHLDEDPLYFRGLDGTNPSVKFPEQVKENGQLTDALRDRGQARFNIYCGPCHGNQGDGQGPVAQKAFDGGPRLQIPPANFHDPRLKGMPAGQIYMAIANGVNNGNMPSYAAQIPVKDRWAIVSYVRKLQRSKDPTVADEGGQILVVAKVDKASADHGKLLYQAKNCVACHTLDGNRLVGPSFKGLYGKTEQTSAGDVVVNDDYVKESMLNPMAKIVNGYPPAMPPQTLDEIEIQSLILFIKTQQ